MRNAILSLLGILLSNVLWAQEITQFQQFNGRFDYTAFGNTLNLVENAVETPCEILTESSAQLNLQPGQTIQNALLYWAGSGSGDFEVTFNGTPITASREFNFLFGGAGSELPYFAAFADVTSIVSATGNGTYTLSDLDLIDDIQPYCQVNGGNSTNFGGWAVYVIYEEATLPLNQIILFDGLEGVSGSNPEVNIVLENLNVLDNTGAKIGFLAWEGDSGIAVNETLSINGNVLSNPLNPADNQFNGTNSFTNNPDFFNMDLDFYDIENNIQPGDETATIQVTSGQDLVLLNNIITVLNTELPDATIEMTNLVGSTDCGDRELEFDWTVFNVNSTGELPAGVSIAFFANNTQVGSDQTTMVLPIGGSESGSATVTIPEGIPPDFELRAIVDEDDAVDELDETNNENILPVRLQVFPITEGLLRDLELCDVVGEELFDLTLALLNIDPKNDASFHLTEDDATNNVNPIVDFTAFENTENPQTIWVRVFNPDCFTVDSFQVEVIICPLPDAIISLEGDIFPCRQRSLDFEYTVENVGTNVLPAETPIAFYADALLIGQSQTNTVLDIGASETGFISIEVPESVPDNFTFRAVVDDTGNGTGIVQELNEFNNEFTIAAEFGELPPIVPIPNIRLCDEGEGVAMVDLTAEKVGLDEINLLEIITQNTTGEVQFFWSQEDAVLNQNPIPNPESFINAFNPQELFVRLENEVCFTTTSFLIVIERCPPVVFEGMSPNGDGKNDVFQINFIIDVYPDFELKIYNRYGTLIYEGGNDQGLWNGVPNRGFPEQNGRVPVGVYYYVLLLNDPDFPEPLTGDLYVNY